MVFMYHLKLDLNRKNATPKEENNKAITLKPSYGKPNNWKNLMMRWNKAGCPSVWRYLVNNSIRVESLAINHAFASSAHYYI